MRTSAILLLASIILPGCNSERSFVKENFRFSQEQTDLMLESIKGDTLIPRTANRDGSLHSSDIYEWTSGFFPGTLWYLYEYNHSQNYKAAAEYWTMLLEPLKSYEGTHDLGFMLYCSLGNSYRLTGNSLYKDILIQGAQSLASRYVPEAGVIRSWNYRKNWNGVTEWWCPVIIDNMMNLELLFFASKVTGERRLYDIAVNHANNTIKNHIRGDFSSYHVVDYCSKTGEVLDRATCQGFSDNSTWARGQAWGIYGFTMTYRETRDKKHLDVAKGMADFYLKNLPEDKVPYWDFNIDQPGYTPYWKYNPDDFDTVPKDASAAAVVASALFELSGYVDEAKGRAYYLAAKEMLHSLASDKYRAKLGENTNFILMHSVGSIPHEVEIDVPLCYADYYFVEALHRYNESLNKQIKR